MKNLVLGMMLVATSAVYAQEVPVVSLNDIKPVTGRNMEMKRVHKHEFVKNTRVNQIEPLFTGIVRIVNGHALIILQDEVKHSSVYAVNLPKESQIDGRVLQFSMRDSRAHIPEGVKAHKAVILEDIIIMPEK